MRPRDHLSDGLQADGSDAQPRSSGSSVLGMGKIAGMLAGALASGPAFAGANDYEISTDNVDVEYGTDIENASSGGWYDLWSFAGDPAQPGTPLAVGVDSDGDMISDGLQLTTDDGRSWTDITSDYTGPFLYPGSYNPSDDHLVVSDDTGTVVAEGYGAGGSMTSSTGYVSSSGGVPCEDPSTGDIWGAVGTGTSGQYEAALLDASSYTTYDLGNNSYGDRFNPANFCYVESIDTAYFLDQNSSQLVIMEHPFDSASRITNETGEEYAPVNPQLATGAYGNRFFVQDAAGVVYSAEDLSIISSGDDTGDTGDTGSADTGDTGGDTGTGDTGAETGDTGAETGDTGAETGDTGGETGDSGETGTEDTGVVSEDCTDVLPSGSALMEHEVTADESALICVPGSETAFELSGPAVVSTSDDDGNGEMDHATVVLEEGATFDVTVDASGDYTVDIDYSTTTETDDGPVDGGVVATLDAGAHADGGAGVDAFMSAQGDWNVCDESGDFQSSAADTPDASKWLYLEAISGGLTVDGKVDMVAQRLEEGQFGTYADGTTCTPATPDTGKTDTAAQDSGNDRDSASAPDDTGTPSDPKCGCASTPLTGRDGVTRFAMLGSLLAGLLSRRRRA